MCLFLAMTASIVGGRFRQSQQGAQVYFSGFPMGYWSRGEQVGASDNFIHGAKAHGRQQKTHFFGDKEKIVDNMFGLTGKLFSQPRVLRGNADGAGV